MSSKTLLGNSACCTAEHTPTTTTLVKIGRFGHLLTDEALYKAFLDYLTREYASENLEFYKKAVELEQCEDPEMVEHTARKIAVFYLGIPGNAEECLLNLPIHYINSIERALQHKFTNKIYMEARMDIETLLRTKYLAFSAT
jgi:hypothetical protein